MGLVEVAMATTWTYAVTRSFFQGATEELSGYAYEIREVYTDDETGEISWTEKPIAPFSETVTGLQDSLSRMTSRSFGNVLDLTVEPYQWISPIEARRKDRKSDG